MQNDRLGRRHFEELRVDLKWPEEFFLSLDVVFLLPHTDPRIGIDHIAVLDRFDRIICYLDI
jgi:hypothetical protein